MASLFQCFRKLNKQVGAERRFATISSENDLYSGSSRDYLYHPKSQTYTQFLERVILVSDGQEFNNDVSVL